MTESDGTTVSHQYFPGFGNKDVYEAFIRCKTIKFYLSDVLNFECDPKHSTLNEETLSLKMTEDFDDAEHVREETQDKSDMQPSVLYKHLCDNDLCKKVDELSSNPLTLESPEYEDFFNKDTNISKCETASSCENKFANRLLPDIHISTITHISSEFDSAKTAPSPLLFTPVKGENTYGAGCLTHKTESQPSSSSFSNNHMGSITKNCFSPIFTTPPPKSAKKMILSSPNCLHSAGKDMKISKQSENQMINNGHEIPSPSVHEEIKIQRDNSYPSSSSPTYNSEEGNVSPPTTFSNQECVNVLPELSPHVEKFSRGRTPSRDPVPTRNCMLDPYLKSSPPNCIVGNDIPSFRPVGPSLSNSSICDNPKKEDGTRHLIRPDPQKPSRVHPRTRRKHRLRTLLSRARHSLAGIPPPPSITVPQLTVTEMLEKIQESKVCDSAPSSLTELPEKTAISISEDSTSLFHPSATEQEIMEMSWPAVLDCIHLGVCYNLGCSSEALEDICQQVREKYVGNETATSCSLWSLPRSLEESSLKRRNGTLQACSVTKEGYITRRRRAFSLASLTTTIPSVASKCRQILVSGVVKKSKEAMKMQAKHKREYEGSRVAKKEDNKRSLSKKCFGDKGKNMSKLNSIRRSLSFDTGSDQQARSSSASVPASSSSSQQAVSSLLMSTKRMLKFESIARAPSEVFSTQKEAIGSNSPSVHSETVLANDSRETNQSFSATGTLDKELSDVHKKKLLWAVAQALRSRGLGTGHDKFKICAIPLFRHCRDEFLNTTGNCKGASVKSGESDDSLCDPVGVTNSHKESTSDMMLCIALGLVDKIMNEVGVEPVIKERAALT